MAINDILELAGVKLSRGYAPDEQYNSLITSKDVEKIQLGLLELQEQIAELCLIKEDGNKSKVLLHRIKALQMKERLIDKRFKALVATRTIKIENRREKRNAIDLAVVMAGFTEQYSRKRSRDDAAFRGEDKVQQSSSKKHELTRTEGMRIALEIVQKGDPNWRPKPEVLAEMGLESEAEEIDENGKPKNSWDNILEELSAIRAKDTTNNFHCPDVLDIAVDTIQQELQDIKGEIKA